MRPCLFISLELEPADQPTNLIYLFAQVLLLVSFTQQYALLYQLSMPTKNGRRYVTFISFRACRAVRSFTLLLLFSH